ncbi:MAG: argininosuccinate lyase [Gammaproteobacteria bacterium]|jgi:argininosuccinate lyase|nr:argininosuccinate lyase [Chromatiales bacterium]MCP4926740.1 argininosuccinate lyase [Gammaproteobacteria bacterium]MDP7153136.1 argininosuccinate lyase [Gammaproteobacteria bacterium]MDP7297429.1 argininosuccinate lyase [Gammaproteobacteria bacterium]MDP7660316.1 argininosuccinate lyase [Gammaproteobacteria bacterium]
MKRLWDKGQQLDSQILRYTAGEDHLLDSRLVDYDVRASIAHATMLNQQSLLSDADLDDIVTGLEELAESFTGGEWTIDLEDEDVHTALESRLTANIGDAGKRIHLGRSRNDQLLAALRLYLLDAADGLETLADEVAAALDALAEREAGTALPGYTHMQQAMPSSVPLWAGGFAAELRDDATGIAASRRRLSKNPLGSAAGYGVPGLPIDRDATSEELGFECVQEPVTAVQLSRGKAEAGLVFELCLLMQDLGRLAADLMLFYTQEFAFITLPDSMTTGSSIMPQKRNPDVLELVRGATATLQAALIEIMNIPAKLSSGYQRDLQRIKPPLFRAIDLTMDSCEIMEHLIAGVSFDVDNIELDESIYAAGRANRLVLEEGISFRDAYRHISKDLDSDE